MDKFLEFLLNKPFGRLLQTAVVFTMIGTLGLLIFILLDIFLPVSLLPIPLSDKKLEHVVSILKSFAFVSIALTFIIYLQRSAHKIELSNFRKIRISYYSDIVRMLESWMYADTKPILKLNIFDKLFGIRRARSDFPLESEINVIFEQLQIRLQNAPDLSIVHYEFHLYPTWIEYGLHIEHDNASVSKEIASIIENNYPPLLEQIDKRVPYKTNWIFFVKHHKGIDLSDRVSLDDVATEFREFVHQSYRHIFSEDNVCKMRGILSSNTADNDHTCSSIS